MKVMDVTMDPPEGSDVTMSIPKQKKLKQARLPFQMLSSPLSSNTSTKKRKLESPSPTSCKSPKVTKLDKKENSLKPLETIEVDMKSDKEDNEINIEASGSPDTMSGSKEKKIEPKHSMKPGALIQFFQKKTAASTPPKPPPLDENPSPLVSSKRCDTKPEENPQESTSTSLTPEKSPKNDESSNEALAEVLPASEIEDEDDENSKDDKSIDNNLDKTDSDTSSSSSSEDDKNDEDSVKNSSDNLLKTPTEKNSNDIPLKKRKLTPKQIEKRLESAKRKEERQKLKAEREIQRNEERLKRRMELEEKKIARKAREEAEKELRKKEREQKELKKQMEIELKQKEKERKDEVKNEEKRKKEEERLEAERKKQKAASTFVSFFVPKKVENNKMSEEEKIDKVSNFMPFQVKGDMKIAPTCRRCLTDEEKSAVEDCLRDEKEMNELFLGEIKKEGRKIWKSGKTWPADDVSKDDVVIIEEEDGGDSSIVNEPDMRVKKHRAKLLLFKENRRPPYWGTWRKKSGVINPRRPFTKDNKWFDYDIDSDEEWEEEEPGESLRGSDDEKDEENPDDNEYDVDNEFMVPHGYLSDEEAQADEEDEEEMPPELQKDKLKILEEEFEAEMKTKTSKIKPKVVGCIWLGFLNTYPENTPGHIVNFLIARQAWIKETPISLIPPAESENQESESLNRKNIPEEAVPDLIRLVHGNHHGRPFLVKEFLTYWNKNHPGHDLSFTKASVSRRIKELSKRIPCPDEGPMHLKTCWYVSEEIRKRYSLEDLHLPNQWTYSLTPKKKTLTEAPELPEKVDKEGKEKLKDSEKEHKKTVPLITMFTKKLTQEEMQKQLQVKSSGSPKPSNLLNRPPKRATLISVPRGEQIQTPSILTAFSKINNVGKVDKTSGRSDEPITISDDESSQSAGVDGDEHEENVLKEDEN